MSIIATAYRNLQSWPRQAVAREVPWKINVQVSHITKKVVMEFWEPVILREIRYRVHREEPIVPFEMSMRYLDQTTVDSLPSKVDNKEAYCNLVWVLFRSVRNIDSGEATELAFRAQRLQNSISSLLEKDLQRRTEHARAIAQGHVQFNVGDVVRHKQFGYRGIVIGYDLKPIIDVSNWDGVKSSSKGIEQPFLHILSDVHDLGT